ncbi:DUF3791 domain-containing protein [Clostridioides difficile]|uniref:DUF3791 domain-containing protein n=1 Tax=unclassified Clostridioides TaxID=2635829 RepID=UPI001D0C55EE|nr:DUF3791 domain-containing protein [Clostridioides difficile]MCC0673685.1 DUF3791 domain-containing protein [Clostridioides sp. ES-S-0145-01]MCC0782869.1 DUF3791 domain-containing protein [Clostridioides sp. ES-S-0108-01]UDN50738.1 DUF3791 domain-containing protein [Clostridioides sp. ES-S-0107-01]MDN9165446.1 DUF3791 domain-containing protein [Clostridioides difficile]
MDERKLEFSIFCIEALAEKLNIDSEGVYKLLKHDTDILDNYIIPCYEALHSQSKSYIVEDLIQVLKEKGVM